MLFADLMNDNQNLPPADFSSALIRMLVALFILLLLLAITYWFLKRLIRHRLTKGGNTQAIQIIEKKMVSPKTVLYLVEADGKRILFAESQLDVQELGKYKEEGREPIRIGKSSHLPD